MYSQSNHERSPKVKEVVNPYVEIDNDISMSASSDNNSMVFHADIDQEEQYIAIPNDFPRFVNTGNEITIIYRCILLV